MTPDSPPPPDASPTPLPDVCVDCGARPTMWFEAELVCRDDYNRRCARYERFNADLRTRIEMFDAIESQARQITALVAALRTHHGFWWSAPEYEFALGDEGAGVVGCEGCAWTFEGPRSEDEAKAAHSDHQDAVIASVMDGAK